MKRKIKFRGKVKHHDPATNPENGWVEGYYVQDLAQGEMCHYIFQPPCSWEVIPETVGQFTGLLDKNGKEIYEGDIVDAWSAGGHLPNGIIKWGEGIAGFFIMPPKCNAVWHLVGNDENKETLEVLGNIHDNPELLKGGAE